MKPGRTLRGALPLLALLAGALAASPSARGAELPEGPPAGAERIRISFDTQVPQELLRLVRGKIIDDDSLDAWALLPGNAALLRAGEPCGDFDAEALRENLWHSILGHPKRRGTGLGSLAFDPLDDLDRMLEELAERGEEIRRRIAAHVGAYLPEEVETLEMAVRFHLGGTWTARATDAVYVNLTRLHEFPPPWFDALASVVAHEAVHILQHQMDDLPRDAFSSVALFGRALERIQSEGVALHVGFGLLDEPERTRSHAAYLLRRQRGDLAGFRTAFAALEELRAACAGGEDAETCRGVLHERVREQGVTRKIGHGIARVIEERLGREALVSAMAEGPRRFFALYQEAARGGADLPVFGEKMLRDMEAAWAAVDERRRVWRLRRESMAAHRRGDYEEAAAGLREILGIEPRDPVDAYNLACALALGGRKSEALASLEQAVDLGYANLEWMEGDPDLDALRSGETYRRLVDRLQSAAGPSNSSMK